MPGGDGTGPSGLGPRTGRAAGYCAGYPSAGYVNPGFGGGRSGYGLGRGLGKGRGRGLGLGRGFGWRAYPYPTYQAAPELTQKQEAGILKDQAKALQEEMSLVNERIKALESEAEKNG